MLVELQNFQSLFSNSEDFRHSLGTLIKVGTLLKHVSLYVVFSLLSLLFTNIAKIRKFTTSFKRLEGFQEAPKILTKKLEHSQ